MREIYRDNSCVVNLYRAGLIEIEDPDDGQAVDIFEEDTPAFIQAIINALPPESREKLLKELTQGEGTAKEEKPRTRELAWRTFYHASEVKPVEDDEVDNDNVVVLSDETSDGTATCAYYDAVGWWCRNDNKLPEALRKPKPRFEVGKVYRVVGDLGHIMTAIPGGVFVASCVDEDGHCWSMNALFDGDPPMSEKGWCVARPDDIESGRVVEVG